jgi:hypothetical protein
MNDGHVTEQTHPDVVRGKIGYRERPYGLLQELFFVTMDAWELEQRKSSASIDALVHRRGLYDSGGVC